MQKVHADKLAFLIDARNYFDALASALDRARHSILILGWDIHSRLRLRRDGTTPPLGELLDGLAVRRKGLHVRILLWDSNALLVPGREKLPALKLGWATHERVELLLDDEHPTGACHHEKIVVVDDGMAFVGGIDLTDRRWDTSAHRSQDDRRIAPDGGAYPPFHDVQVALAGPAAAALGEHARDRWRRAGGDLSNEMRAQRPADPWPTDLDPDLEHVEVELARTVATHAGRPGRREIEAFYREAIGSAKRSVYIENQYLTSQTIRELLQDSLRADHGPEICIVVPYTLSGWLEERLMSQLRWRVVAALREADRGRRLRVWYPVGPDDDAAPPIVHSKVCVVDERLLTVGSANLSNRSLALDTECNLVLRAGSRKDVSRAIRGLRDRLLAEHAGLPCEALKRMLARQGSVIAAIESIPEPELRLRALESRPADWIDEALSSAAPLADPERPLDWQAFVRLFSEEDPGR